MKTIFFHRVELTDGSGIIKSGKGYGVFELEIVAESDKELVVLSPDYGNFTVVRKGNDKYNMCMEKEIIGLTVGDSLLGSRVSYTLFSTSRRRASTIRKHIEAEISRKFGFFTNKIDLSIINDGNEAVVKR